MWNRQNKFKHQILFIDDLAKISVIQRLLDDYCLADPGLETSPQPPLQSLGNSVYSLTCWWLLAGSCCPTLGKVYFLNQQPKHFKRHVFYFEIKWPLSSLCHTFHSFITAWQDVFQVFTAKSASSMHSKRPRQPESDQSQRGFWCSTAYLHAPWPISR